jgi:run domain Beclin-1 interacting cysteine-rich containing protein
LGEQVKCNRQLHIAEETGEVDESDEEINHLKQRIRMRRRQRQEEKRRHLIPVSLLSDGKTDSKCVGKLRVWAGEGQHSDDS